VLCRLPLGAGDSTPSLPGGGGTRRHARGLERFISPRETAGRMQTNPLDQAQGKDGNQGKNHYCLDQTLAETTTI